MNILALAGGVGGAKLAAGLAAEVTPERLTVVVNTGDDFRHFGLKICPDLDTICYTLAGLAHPDTGWGRAGETWSALDAIRTLGGPTWFNLGDRDLGTHLERTRLLGEGAPLSEVVKRFCQAWGVDVRVLPMTDAEVATMVQTDEGLLEFQDFFVRRRCEPEVRGFVFRGAEMAYAAPGVLEAISAAQAVMICPSNPWVSIDPILSVPEIRAALPGKPVVAVSPIVAGQAIRGPAAKMYRDLGLLPSPLAVAQHYSDLLVGLVMDNQDEDFAGAVKQSGVVPLVTDTIMKSGADRARLAREVMEFAGRLAV